MTKKVYAVKKINETKGEVSIYGDITEWRWSEEEVSANSFSKEIEALGDVLEIDVRINSDGGNVTQALAIYNTLKRNKAKINTYVDGIAASAASLIFMAGDNRYMPKSSLLMLHNPSSSAYGNAEELRKRADDLDKYRDIMLNAYSNPKSSDEDIKKILDDETYFTPEEALDAGFATEILEDSISITMNLKNKVLNAGNKKFDVSSYRKFEFFAKKNIKIEEEEMAIKNIDDLKEQHPEIFANAKELGAKEERERIQKLDALMMDGAEEIIANAKFVAPKTPEEVSMAICMAAKKGEINMSNKPIPNKEPGIEVFNNKKNDAETSGANEIEGSENEEKTPEVLAKEKAKERAGRIAMKLNKKRGVN